jgi:hypothetical protein
MRIRDKHAESKEKYSEVEPLVYIAALAPQLPVKKKRNKEIHMTAEILRNKPCPTQEFEKFVC